MHGKLKSKDKEAIMNQFKHWHIQMLVATTVIEVGVDIPEATIIVIYNSERFGLSQLHQLRGRIGRNDLQSYCFLETRSKSWPSYQRLKAMEDTTDGFKLAQVDLQYRGSGEILWTRQSGETDIPLEIISDISFVQKAKSWAETIIQKYPDFVWLEKLKQFIFSKIGTILS
jgi:ATP-dependent DNA helicase RecG